jgi:hypothetical protein
MHALHGQADVVTAITAATGFCCMAGGAVVHHRLFRGEGKRLAHVCPADLVSQLSLGPSMLPQRLIETCRINPRHSEAW